MRDVRPERDPAGEVLDHVSLDVADLARAAAFYDAVLARLGGRRVHDTAAAIAYGRADARLWLVAADPAWTAGGPRPGHLALTAAGRAAVDAAHTAGLAAGGTDDGAPEHRPQRAPSYYSGYLRDPDGHRLELVSGAR